MNSQIKIVLKTSEPHDGARIFYSSHGYKEIAKLANLWYRADWYFFEKEL